MTEIFQKSLVVPIDGSDNSKKALKYLSHLYGSDDNIIMTLCYILPTVPPLFADPELSPEFSGYLKDIKEKNIQMAKKIISAGKAYLLEWGFKPDQVQTVYRAKETGVARDICRFTENKQADAIVLATLGRSRLEAFFMGKVSHDILENSRNTPVWLVNGSVSEGNILIGIDPSDYALKAVDHAGFMLAGTDCHITLFHTYRHLRRFLPKEVLDAAPASELEKIWYQMAGHEITPYINKARKMLIEAGLKETQISTKIVDGSRSAAADILDEARKSGCGTVVLGRWGASDDNELKLGSVTRKVIHDSRGLSVWIV